MKNLINIIAIILSMSSTAIAQDNRINKDDINNNLKLISDSLPDGWTAGTDTAFPGEIIIQSAVIDLNPDMASNDPLILKGECEIFVLTVPRISPDSIAVIRKKNQELRNDLPPQNSKNNLKDWYKQNEKTLNILDAEPTNYDNKYSYRIKCRRLPLNETDKSEYNKIRTFLNRLYPKFQDN
jgi:hypothetical protein